MPFGSYSHFLAIDGGTEWLAVEIEQISKPSNLAVGWKAVIRSSRLNGH
jgi:hypothetical protein